MKDRVEWLKDRVEVVEGQRRRVGWLVFPGVEGQRKLVEKARGRVVVEVVEGQRRRVERRRERVVEWLVVG